MRVRRRVAVPRVRVRRVRSSADVVIRCFRVVSDGPVGGWTSFASDPPAVPVGGLFASASAVSATTIAPAAAAATVAVTSATVSTIPAADIPATGPIAGRSETIRESSAPAATRSLADCRPRNSMSDSTSGSLAPSGGEVLPIVSQPAFGPGQPGPLERVDRVRPPVRWSNAMHCRSLSGPRESERDAGQIGVQRRLRPRP